MGGEHGDDVRPAGGFDEADVVGEALPRAGLVADGRAGRESGGDAVAPFLVEEQIAGVAPGIGRKVFAANDGFHEAGHALVQFFLPYTDPVQKITIIPRGRAGGFVMTLPQDRMLHSREYFEARISTMLAGRAAEEIAFGRITTGASNDLQQATRFARAMVMQYGMSARVGLLAFEENNGGIFLGRDLSYGRNYSEATATIIDEEVNRITDEAYQKAKATIREHRDKLEVLAHTLIDVETLDREEFEGLMNREPMVVMEEPSIIA